MKQRWLVVAIGLPLLLLVLLACPAWATMLLVCAIAGIAAYELLHTVDQDKVDAYIPYQQFANRMDLDNPKATCITAGPLYNMEFRYQQHQASGNRSA